MNTNNLLQKAVRIKRRSECTNVDSYPYYTDVLARYEGKITYIQGVNDDGYIYLSGVFHTLWRLEWLELIGEPMDNKTQLCPPSQFRDTFTQQDIDTINKIGIKDEEVVAAGGTKFETGAVRSGEANTVMYQLISPIGMRRLAETMKEGFDKYGAYNWERGMPIGDILNHALRHIFIYLSGDRSEDHLAHAAWNLFASMHMEETHPSLNHGLRRSIVNTEPMTSEEFQKILKG
jgi:hypothetical protein